MNELLSPWPTCRSRLTWISTLDWMVRCVMHSGGLIGGKYRCQQPVSPVSPCCTAPSRTKPPNQTGPLQGLRSYIRRFPASAGMNLSRKSAILKQRRGWSLMIFCARATRGLRRMGEGRPGALLARGTRTIRMCTFDARSKGQPRPLL